LRAIYRGCVKKSILKVGIALDELLAKKGSIRHILEQTYVDGISLEVGEKQTRGRVIHGGCGD
jgi:hypothetical protein